MEWLILGGLLIVFMFWSSNNAKKKMQQQIKAREEMEASLEAGTWVHLSNGFYGKIVEINGKVAVLEGPTGEESLWDSNQIVSITEPPFAAVAEGETDENVEDPQDTPAQDAVVAAEVNTPDKDEDNPKTDTTGPDVSAPKI
ncbi:MAG: preprotein translocase subunit YajC [Actinomycetaceae bacterium]|nr:preprotein translocase subunit YajC [Actinomycetaceae bacterium]